MTTAYQGTQSPMLQSKKGSPLKKPIFIQTTSINETQHSPRLFCCGATKKITSNMECQRPFQYNRVSSAAMQPTSPSAGLIEQLAGLPPL